MKKQTMAILLGIALISLTSAMYAGTCEQINLSELESLDNVVYIAVGNQSNLEGLNITLNGTKVSICPEINYKPDNFTLIFWDDSPEVITNTIIEYRGGGGGGTHYVDRNVTQNITKYIDRPITTYLTNDTFCGVKIICEDTLQDEKDFWNKKGWERFWNWISNLFVTNK